MQKEPLIPAAPEEEDGGQHSLCGEKFAVEVSVSALMNPRGRAAASLKKLSRRPARDFDRAKLGGSLEKRKGAED
jgi:hypothetical protein